MATTKSISIDPTFVTSTYYLGKKACVTNINVEPPGDYNWIGYSLKKYQTDTYLRSSITSTGNSFNSESYDLDMSRYYTDLAAYQAVRLRQQALYAAYKLKRNASFVAYILSLQRSAAARKNIKRSLPPKQYETVKGKRVLLSRHYYKVIKSEVFLCVDRYKDGYFIGTTRTHVSSWTLTSFFYPRFVWLHFTKPIKPRRSAHSVAVASLMKPCSQTTLRSTGHITVKKDFNRKYRAYGETCPTGLTSLYWERSRPTYVTADASNWVSKLQSAQMLCTFISQEEITQQVLAKVNYDLYGNVPSPVSLLQQLLETVELAIIAKEGMRTFVRLAALWSKNPISAAAAAFLLWSLVIRPTIQAIQDLLSMTERLITFVEEWNKQAKHVDKVHYRDTKHAIQPLVRSGNLKYDGYADGYFAATINVIRSPLSIDLESLKGIKSQLLGLSVADRSLESYSFEIWQAFPLSFVVDFFVPVADALNELKFRPPAMASQICYGYKREAILSVVPNELATTSVWYIDHGYYTLDALEGEVIMSRKSYLRSVESMILTPPQYELQDLTPMKAAILAALAIAALPL